MTNSSILFGCDGFKLWYYDWDLLISWWDRNDVFIHITWIWWKIIKLFMVPWLRSPVYWWDWDDIFIHIIWRWWKIIEHLSYIYESNIFQQSRILLVMSRKDSYAGHPCILPPLPFSYEKRNRNGKFFRPSTNTFIITIKFEEDV